MILTGPGCTELSVDPFDNVTSNDYVIAEPFAFRVSAAGSSKLQLEGVSGNVTIEGSSQADSVIIICEKRVGSDSREDAQLHLDDLYVRIQNLDETIFVKTIQPDETNGRSYVVDYLITVPKNYEIEIVLINGSIQIDSIENNIKITNVNGNVTLNEIIGSTYINTINGNIANKQAIPQHGVIRHFTVNGSIGLSIPDNSSADFSASVANGSIEIENLVIQITSITPLSYQGIMGSGQGNIFLETVNGSIRVDGY
ncbi:hypothetical protein ACFLTH_09525 [Bacteroidota bacterium]